MIVSPSWGFEPKKSYALSTVSGDRLRSLSAAVCLSVSSYLGPSVRAVTAKDSFLLKKYPVFTIAQRKRNHLINIAHLAYKAQLY